ncbi:Glyoxalase-like domain protein [compost metagenome]
MSFGLYVKDADAVYQKAIDSGASVVMAVEDMFYGDRVGQVMNPFGYKWMITTHKEDMSFEEMQRRFDKMLAVQ